MTNDEWLKSLEPAELKAWFEAEHADGTRNKNDRSVEHGSRAERESDALLDSKMTVAERELVAHAERLERENMALARDLGSCMAERDGYREKLGRAVDSAWEIVQLMDEGAA